MNIENHCEHTYLRWELDTLVAICAVCQKPFPDMEYDPSFVGTFAREDYRRKQVKNFGDVIYTTHSANYPKFYRLDEE